MCIKKIWDEITYNGWYAIKLNQPTNQPTDSVHLYTYAAPSARAIEYADCISAEG